MKPTTLIPTGVQTTIILYFLLMYALILGMSAGLSADTRAEATVDVPRSELDVDPSDLERDDPPYVTWVNQYLPTWLQSDSEINTELERRVAAAIAAGVERLLVAGVALADMVAVWAYDNRAWIDPGIASTVLQWLAYAGPVNIIVYKLWRWGLLQKIL